MAQFKDWKYAEMFCDWAQRQVDDGKLEPFNRDAVMGRELRIAHLDVSCYDELCAWVHSGASGHLLSECSGVFGNSSDPVPSYATGDCEPMPQCGCGTPAPTESVSIADLPQTEVAHQVDIATVQHTRATTPATAYNAHYAAIKHALGVEPIHIGEAIVDRESIPRKASKHLATAAEYLARAGTKDGEAWKKDAQKASNHIFRALNGRWPWDPEQRSH